MSGFYTTVSTASPSFARSVYVSMPFALPQRIGEDMVGFSNKDTSKVQFAHLEEFCEQNSSHRTQDSNNTPWNPAVRMSGHLIQRSYKIWLARSRRIVQSTILPRVSGAKEYTFSACVCKLKKLANTEVAREQQKRKLLPTTTHPSLNRPQTQTICLQ